MVPTDLILFFWILYTPAYYSFNRDTNSFLTGVYPMNRFRRPSSANVLLTAKACDVPAHSFVTK
jgi:hypothetical protein